MSAARLSRLRQHLCAGEEFDAAAVHEAAVAANPSCNVETGTKALLARIEDGIGVLTINAPHRANALGDDLTPFIRHMLHTWKDNADVRCLILTGAGKAFCAGGNMMGSDDVSVTPPPLPPAPDGWTPDPNDEHGRFKQMQRTLTGAIWGFPKPTIAALPGAAAGLGAAIALSTDLRVAAHEGFLTMQYINVGMSGDYGGTWLITQLVGPAKGKELAFTGERVYGEEGKKLGIFNKVVPKESLIDETMKLAEVIAGKPPLAMRRLKDNMNFATMGTGFLTALDREGVNLIEHTRSPEGNREYKESVAKLSIRQKKR